MPDLGLAVPSAFHRNKSGAADETPFPFAEGLCKARGCQGSELPHGGKLFQGEVFSLHFHLEKARPRINIKVSFPHRPLWSWSKCFPNSFAKARGLVSYVKALILY